MDATTSARVLSEDITAALPAEDMARRLSFAVMTTISASGLFIVISAA
jgi:hypothetical protein